MHTRSAALVVGVCALVVLVLQTTHAPQIGQPVVVLLSVDVVNLSIWPFAVHIEPRKAVGEIFPSEDDDPLVLIGRDVAGNGACLDFGCNAFCPRKDARLLVVVQHLKKLCSADRRVVAHAIVLCSSFHIRLLGFVCQWVDSSNASLFCQQQRYFLRDNPPHRPTGRKKAARGRLGGWWDGSRSVVVEGRVTGRAFDQGYGVSAVRVIVVALAAAGNGLAVACVVDPVPLALIVFSFDVARIGDCCHE